jgi:hypothetical protein
VTEQERQLAAQHAAAMWGGFYRCPTTGRIVEALPHDDKLICHCGRSNPKVPAEGTERTGVHIVRFLQPATALEYVDQCESDRQAMPASPARS